MISHIPCDLELMFPYKELVKRLGEVQAAFVFQRLWCHLALQARAHGRSGLYKAEYLPHFEDTTKAVPDAIKALRNSGIVRVIKDGDLFCPLFYHYNSHLDMSFVPPSVKWIGDWDKWREKMAERGKGQAAWIPKLAWYLPNGETVPETVMNRALVLINILDVILHRYPRQPKDLEVGTIHAAIRVVQRNAEGKLSVVTKRFLAVSRPSKNPLYPPTTEEALEQWDDLVIMISPDDGFEAWMRRIDNLQPIETYAEESKHEAVGEAVNNELTEVLARVPA
jgi:hypothetical protein